MDTINLVSARNGKVGRIYFLIVMPVYGTVSREGSIFSWLWLSPARATHLTGHMGASHVPHGSRVSRKRSSAAVRRNWSRVGHGGWWEAHTVTVGGVGPSPGKATCLSGDHLGNLCKEEALPVLYSENPKSYTLCAGNCLFGMSLHMLMT